MFEFIRSHTRVLFFVLLVLIIPSFVFFGIDGYQRMDGDGNQTVATVAGNPITRIEWDNAHRAQVDRARQRMPDVDLRLLDTPQMRRQALDALIRERVMLAASNDLNLVTPDDRLRRLFATDPQFEFLRNPDGTVNRDLLAAQGMSSEVFAQRLRQDLSMQQVVLGITGSSFATSAVADPALDALFQQREVQVLMFDAASRAARIQPTDAEIEAYYVDPANAARYQAPEQIDVEYTVLDVDTLLKNVVVPEEELRKYYEQNAARYATPEERRASHILIAADASAPAGQRAAAREKAEGLLAEVRAKPALFASLAAKNSDDPGSAARGGDLDFFGRGSMVKPFEEAVFSLEPGQVSDIVETDFGFHIIRVTDKRGGERRAFESVRDDIAKELRTAQAQRQYAEAAVDFSNLVYEQSESLTPAVERFRLSLDTATGVTRTPPPGATGPLANPKFLEALFSTESIRTKRNIDAVEIGPSQLASGRVVQHLPARLLPLAEVREQVRQSLIAQQAAALARKDGQARLEALQQAPQTPLSEPSQIVSRLEARNLPRPLIDAVLRAPAANLPAVFGVDLGPQGYAVVKLNKVLGRDPATSDPALGRAQYAQAWAEAELEAYYQALKTRYKVSVEVQPGAAVEPVR